MGIIADVRAGIVTVLEQVKTANPTLLGEVHSARPASFALGLPLAYVGDFRANIHREASLRQWTGGQQDVVVVATSWDNEEWQADMDTLVQTIVDAFPADGHIVPNLVAEPVALRTAAELVEGGISYPAVVITIGRITHLEGR